MKLAIYISLFLILFHPPVFAQKNLYKIKDTYTVNYANLDSIVKAEVYNDKKDFKPHQEHFYYWYYLGKILITEGSYEGRLLHGTYVCFYNNDNIKEKGNFKDGKKTGKWIGWYPSGKIKEVSYWAESKKHGHDEFYTEDGKLLRKLKYKNGKLNGEWIEYKDGKEISKKKFKDGAEIQPKPAEIKANKTDTASHKKNFFKGLFKRSAADSSNAKPITKAVTNTPSPEKTKKEKNANTSKKETVPNTVVAPAEQKKKKKEKDKKPGSK